MTGPTPDEVLGELHIMNGWLVQDVGEHTCGSGGSESGGAHEPGCGLEPLMTVEELRAALAARTPQPAVPDGDGPTRRLQGIADLLDRTLADDPLCMCGSSAPCECGDGTGIEIPVIPISDVRRALGGEHVPTWSAVPDGDDADELLLVRMPGRKSGRVTIGHSRLPVETIWQLLADAGDDDDRIVNAFPPVDTAALRVLRRLRDDLAEPTPDGDDVPASCELCGGTNPSCYACGGEHGGGLHETGPSAPQPAGPTPDDVPARLDAAAGVRHEDEWAVFCGNPTDAEDIVQVFDELAGAEELAQRVIDAHIGYRCLTITEPEWKVLERCSACGSVLDGEMCGEPDDPARTPQPAVPRGDDVPARLDAAADAMEECGFHGMAYELREIATQLDDGEGGIPALRAAVAAALARPTGEQG